MNAGPRPVLHTTMGPPLPPRGPIRNNRTMMPPPHPRRINETGRPRNNFQANMAGRISFPPGPLRGNMSMRPPRPPRNNLASKQPMPSRVNTALRPSIPARNNMNMRPPGQMAMRHSGSSGNNLVGGPSRPSLPLRVKARGRPVASGDSVDGKSGAAKDVKFLRVSRQNRLAFLDRKSKCPCMP